ncbi:MAG: multicopper oxidase family protein [Burkholderiales bacterium]|nr:multicopper oxidase family protein [Burkholderiales bacterium]
MKKLLVVLFVFQSVISMATTVLNVESRTIIVQGKGIPFNTITQDNGTWGYMGKQGESFNVIVNNLLNESTVLHWHGIVLPNSQDGVDGLTQNDPIPPHESMAYSFTLNHHGTYWIHSHYGLQEQIGIEAPLIVLDMNDHLYKQVVVMFQDFSFKSPEQIMKDLKGDTSTTATHNHNIAVDNIDSMDHDNHKDHLNSMHNMHSMEEMDLNDVKYDAYLTNYHSPDMPQITRVKARDVVRLRFINGASASNFWINLGRLNGTVISVDGQDIKPIRGNKFPIAMGQRVDILIKIPKSGGVFPILGQVEGLKDQTGLILTTKLDYKENIPALAKNKVPAIGYQLDKKIESLKPIKFMSSTGITKHFNVVLNGDMDNYSWTMNNQLWPNITPLVVDDGDLVNITFDNKSMMSHPMHLHGYLFKVISIDGKPTKGFLRDTIIVMPHSKVTVQFVADNPGKWLLHCHVAYHMEAGMMTYLQVNK